MAWRIAIWSLVVLWMLPSGNAAAAAERNRETADPFALDGARNIVDELNFGIVNGKMSAGIPYRNALAVWGLWAPPYVSTNVKVEVALMGQPVATEHYTWHPFHVERSGSVPGVAVDTVTMLIPGTRAGLVEATLTDVGMAMPAVPVAISVTGIPREGPPRPDWLPTLDRAPRWEFGAPESQTAVKPHVANGSLRLEQDGQAIVLRAGQGIQWTNAQPYGRGMIRLPPSGSVKLYVVFAVGPTAEAQAACDAIAADPAKALTAARAAYAERVRDFFQKLPRLESDNPALECFYYRSLVPLLMNRWDVPEFALHPYYSTGSVTGGCVGDYLWDFGENWEIFPLLDAEASRTHIKQFLLTDMTKHFAFDAMTGTVFGVWYPVNQEKIIGMIYYHVKNTGDVAFLKDVVAGKTVLEHVLANAVHGEDPAKPVGLIDYGPSNSHLELRKGFPYNHVMSDLNGRRYDNYVRAAELAELAGKPAPQLLQRAEALKTVLKQRLWNKEARWFNFQDGNGKNDIRYTVQMFKLFGSKVLDAEEEAGLLAHLNSEAEFLSKFGLHSMSKTDVAYDQVDIDNGGGGCYQAFPPQIAERLYKAGKPAAAENILKRILWWGDRAPYWGDSMVANQIDYRRDTPLQSDISAAAAAQSVIFGMFGVRTEFNGDIRIHPQPPSFAPRLKLVGLRLRGHVLQIDVRDGEYEVRDGDRSIRAPVGKTVLVRGDKLTVDENLP